MGFVFRAAFWFAVVGAFMPRDVHAEQDAATPASTDEALFDATAAAARFCADQPEVCAAGAEAATIGRAATGAAVRLAREEAQSTR